MVKTQIKIILASDVDSLERKANEWMASTPNIQIITANTTVDKVDVSTCRHILTILYNGRMAASGSNTIIIGRDDDE